MAQAKTGHTAIVGGGISGLSAALEALERGEKNIHVYEASGRFGGKIQSSKIGDYTVNMGAEFIDSEEENPHLHKIARRVGVALKPTGEQSKEIFYASDGKAMPDFLERYSPIARRLEKLREEMEADPGLAKKIHAMSAKELLTKLGNEVPANQPAKLFEPTGNFMLDMVISGANIAYGALKGLGNFAYDALMVVTLQSSRSNRVSQDVLDVAQGAIEKELGTKLENVTAKQFVSEFSPSEDRFLASSCSHRVEGGTEALVIALKKHLEEKGVHFHTNHKLTSVQSKDGKKILTFTTPGGEEIVESDNTVVAVAAYALPNINWLDANGNPDKDMEFLREMGKVQYTNNAKITFKVKPGVKLPTDEANAFLPVGEFWSTDPGYLTVLYHNENGDKPAAVMKKTMEAFAKSMGKRVEDIFELEAGKPAVGSFVYTNPGNAPCYSTPSSKTGREIEQYFARMEALASKGIGFAGTYISLPDGGTGFMECGAASAERACERMFGPVKAQEQEMDLSQNLSPSLPFAARVQSNKHQHNAHRGNLSI